MRKGQVMILTVLAIGGTLLGATTLAGILMVYQIRQSTDMLNSAKAVYAADTGIEWALYQFFRPTSAHPHPGVSIPGTPNGGILSNGAIFVVKCLDAANSEVSCTADEATFIRSVGTSANVSRALELNLGSGSPTDIPNSFVVGGPIGGTFKIIIENPGEAAEAFNCLGKQCGKHVLGQIAASDGGFNAPWSWHLIPSTVVMTEASTEVCDGSLSDVESEGVNFDNGFFCPWDSVIVGTF